MAASTELFPGLALHRLGDTPGPEHAAARTFCLAVIKEFYGFDYRPDWHGDLDSLEKPAADSHFSAKNRGAFWVFYQADGSIAATAGIKALTWHANVIQSLGDRYADPKSVATLMRVYVRRSLRGGGIGRRLNALAEAEARALGYRTLYLHASSDTPATIGFWKSQGYEAIGAFGFSTHFDKSLSE